MLSIRVIPCLLLKGTGLVKTIKFKDPKYVGDPRNAVKIFNENEVDELLLLDIDATPLNIEPNYELIGEIVSEAFMPVAYGGGITNYEQAKTLLSLGVEKVVIAAMAVQDPSFIRNLANSIGSQSVVVCIDVRKTILGGHEVYVINGRTRAGITAEVHASRVVEMGAGYIVINSIDRDGTMSGYDVPLLNKIRDVVKVPIVALGGAAKLEDIREAVEEGGASAIAAGSMFIFRGKQRAVLISYPKATDLQAAFQDIISSSQVRE